MSYLSSRARAGNRPPVKAVFYEPDPFADVVRQYRPLVTRAAYRITRNIEDAHDVAQFVFMQMYVNSPQLDDDRAVDRWLYVVTRNKALDVYCRRRREESLATLEGCNLSGMGLEEIVLQNERNRHVRAAIRMLPAPQRRVIELRHLMSFPPTEIADRLGISTERVKREVERATFRLRAEMRRCKLDRDVP